ncbi:hypothetical protein G7068_07295 [Leucobacter viscericola]|uniref:SLH domain-containing protein n=1 Tax=Leucobacter viscericola TaxID=2714935 RepID=A0A6G7XET4_9MICO|nr:S-layer homology domain-containing protein [Leucobacter viscericola]QIK63022.1 hypothetical protein G7068_07295 [Leucobacter viscericola]
MENSSLGLVRVINVRPVRRKSSSKGLKVSLIAFLAAAMVVVGTPNPALADPQPPESDLFVEDQVEESGQDAEPELSNTEISDESLSAKSASEPEPVQPAVEEPLPTASAEAVSDLKYLGDLFASAQAGATITVPARTYNLTGDVIELPYASNVTVIATGATFTGQATFGSALGQGLKWTGGTFTAGGSGGSVHFALMQVKNAAFTDMKFDRAVAFRTHVFDVMASDSIRINNIRVIGYGSGTDFTGLTDHARYAEAVQIDRHAEGSGGNAWNYGLDRLFKKRAGGNYFLPDRHSTNVTVENSTFEAARDGSGKVISWAQSPIGQHFAGSSNEAINIVFRNNVVIDPVPVGGTAYDGALHFSPVAGLTVTGNTFRANERIGVWIQLVTEKKLTKGVNISGNKFYGMKPSNSFVNISVVGNAAGSAPLVSGVSIKDNSSYVEDIVPMRVAQQGKTARIAPITQSNNVYRGPNFYDVPESYGFFKEIKWMKDAGITTGNADGSFEPKVNTSRVAIAAFMYRAKKASYTGPSSSPFADVQPGDKFYNEIAWMHKEGISTGTSQGPGKKPLFLPSDSISREAMAAFMYRSEKATAPAPAVSPFADVKTTDTFYKQIAWMHSSGISNGTKQPSGKPLFEPKNLVTREATAVFLYRVRAEPDALKYNYLSGHVTNFPGRKCTGGYVVAGTSGTFIMTAGHCGNTGQIVSGTQAPFAKVAAKKPTDGSDSLLMSAYAGVTLPQIVIDPVGKQYPGTNGQIKGVVSSSRQVEGFLVGKMGATSGWTEGKITGEISWYGRTAICSTAQTRPGDSGGPVWRSENGVVRAVGMMVAYEPATGHGCYLPMDQLLKDWGAWLPLYGGGTAPASSASESQIPSDLPKLDSRNFVEAVG